MSEKTIAEKAAEQGWVPKDDWKGDPDQWRPAEEFVKRGENIIPIMRKNQEKTLAELAEMKSDMDMLIKTQQQELKRVQQESYDKAKADFEEKKRELDDKEADAVTKGDTEAFKEVKKERENLKEPEKPQEPEEPPKNEVSPVFEDWHKKNDWYALDINDPGNANKLLTYEAIRISKELAESGKIKSEKELYESVGKKIKELYPEEFENKNRKEDTMVDSSNHSGDEGGTKGWDDLPASAKKTFKRLQQRVPTMTEEDYAKGYFEG